MTQNNLHNSEILQVYLPLFNVSSLGYPAVIPMIVQFFLHLPQHTSQLILITTSTPVENDLMPQLQNFNNYTTFFSTRRHIITFYQISLCLLWQSFLAMGMECRT